MFADRLLPDAPVSSLDEYEARGGGEALARIHDDGPDAVIDEISRAGLRGRGGAGFPTGTKWRSVRGGASEKGERYVVANGAEGEPGTFKDRPLLRRNPYQVLEGLFVAMDAVGADEGYIAMKRSFEPEIAAVERALAEMTAGGWTGSRRVFVVKGPEEYLFGEEKGLLEVVEGEDPLPRMFPPYLYGLFTAQPQMGWSAAPDESSGPGDGSNPTVVNNVETLANVLPILTHGAEWYRELGTDESPGSVLVTVSGDTVRAGYAEVAMGTPLGWVLDHVGGGMPAGRTVKAVLSGVANPALPGGALDLPLTYEAMEAAGSGLGAAGFLVYDDRRDGIGIAHAVSRFLYVESCGQCPACKFGTGEITAYLERLLAGEGSEHDVEVIDARLDTVADANRCYLPVQEQRVVPSLLNLFPDDLAGVLDGRAPLPVPPITKIVDIVDGEAVLDQRQPYKLPDWTYGDELPVTVAAARRPRRAGSV